MPFRPRRLAMIMNGFGDYGSALKRSTVSKVKTDEENRDGKGGDNGKLVLMEAEEDPAGPSEHDVFKGFIQTKDHVWLANANTYPIHLHTPGI